MASVSVTDLKAHLSRYLRMVRKGSEVQVTERGVPVARLVGLDRNARGADQHRLERLTELGVLRRGTGNLEWLLVEPKIRADSADLAGALADDREDRA